jgi:hypothetical protein
MYFVCVFVIFGYRWYWNCWWLIVFHLNRCRYFYWAPRETTEACWRSYWSREASGTVPGLSFVFYGPCFFWSGNSLQPSNKWIIRYMLLFRNLHFLACSLLLCFRFQSQWISSLRPMQMKKVLNRFFVLYCQNLFADSQVDQIMIGQTCGMICNACERRLFLSLTQSIC